MPMVGNCFCLAIFVSFTLEADVIPQGHVDSLIDREYVSLAGNVYVIGREHSPMSLLGNMLRCLEKEFTPMSFIGNTVHEYGM